MINIIQCKNASENAKKTIFDKKALLYNYVTFQNKFEKYQNPKKKPFFDEGNSKNAVLISWIETHNFNFTIFSPSLIKVDILYLLVTSELTLIRINYPSSDTEILVLKKKNDYDDIVTRIKGYQAKKNDIRRFKIL